MESLIGNSVSHDTIKLRDMLNEKYLCLNTDLSLYEESLHGKYFLAHIVYAYVTLISRGFKKALNSIFIFSTYKIFRKKH